MRDSGIDFFVLQKIFKCLFDIDRRDHGFFCTDLLTIPKKNTRDAAFFHSQPLNFAYTADCAAAFPLVKEIERWLRGELCFVFRHFPVAETHPHALEAAEAAEAAGTQGKFWEMYDLLCEHSAALDNVHLNHYAQALGLDLERFERELREHAYLARVQEDFASGIASGVIRTPTFFINGVQYSGDSDLDSLLAAIEEAGNQSGADGTGH